LVDSWLDGAEEELDGFEFVDGLFPMVKNCFTLVGRAVSGSELGEGRVEYSNLCHGVWQVCRVGMSDRRPQGIDDEVEDGGGSDLVEGHQPQPFR